MNKMILKLIAAGLTLTLSILLVLMTTYAWFNLSISPEVGGIQVTMGDNTIRVAADVTETVNGVTYHYPGAFSDTLNFATEDSYDYLSDLAGLKPVSTADGIHWFLPAGSGSSSRRLFDVELSDGDVEEFLLDNTLSQANLPANSDNAKAGSYIYLDFWVVAPAEDYTLRVSTSQDAGGSFLMELPRAVKDKDGNYSLEDTSGVASAVARVGFLVNDQKIADDTLVYYQQSENGTDAYSQLRGNYHEPGDTVSTEFSYRFSIYEPNGDYHPETGSTGYTVTKPIGLNEAVAEEVTVQKQTAVQRASTWLTGSDGTERILDQLFQTYMIGKSNLDADAATAAFYSSLQGQISPYISKGEFIEYSARLVDLSGEDLALLDGEGFTGAADDVYIIELERGIPQRIRMFVWLEGQDPDCVDNAAISNIALNLELAGSNQK